MTKLIIYAAIAVVVLGAIGGFAAKLYNDGVQAERQAQLKKSIELVKERDKLDITLRNATAEDICRRLGGKTVNGECI
jgi:hypothetical protein